MSNRVVGVALILRLFPSNCHVFANDRATFVLRAVKEGTINFDALTTRRIKTHLSPSLSLRRVMRLLADRKCLSLPSKTDVPSSSSKSRKFRLDNWVVRLHRWLWKRAANAEEPRTRLQIKQDVSET